MYAAALLGIVLPLKGLGGTALVFESQVSFESSFRPARRQTQHRSRREPIARLARHLTRRAFPPARKC